MAEAKKHRQPKAEKRPGFLCAIISLTAVIAVSALALCKCLADISYTGHSGESRRWYESICDVIASVDSTVLYLTLLIVAMISFIHAVVACSQCKRFRGSEPLGKPESDTGAPSDKERVGILLVHGVGEQRRFEHLEAQARNIARALRQSACKHGGTVQVRVNTEAGVSQYLGENEMWATGDAPVVVEVQQNGARTTELHFREVWWADLDERTTICKWFRFWVWALSMWALRGHRECCLEGFERSMTDPQPHTTSRWCKVRLFFVAVAFLTVQPILWIINIFLRRFLGLSRAGVRADFFASYIGDIKLLQDKASDSRDPLDGLGDPPRVALRRRLVRGLVEMALGHYNRWYIMAHSEGTVLTFNGLMETEEALPNYLDKKLWDRAQCGLGSTASKSVPEKMMPCRPSWLSQNDVILRQKLFEKLKGVLMYGTAIRKVAAIWPVIVPVNRDTSVLKGVEWVNVYDPTDPVADPLNGVLGRKNDVKIKDIAFKARGLHLVSHMKYLQFCRKYSDGLVNVAASWLKDGGQFKPLNYGRWLPEKGLTLSALRFQKFLIWTAVYLPCACFVSAFVDMPSIGPILSRVGELLPCVAELPKECVTDVLTRCCAQDGEVLRDNFPGGSPTMWTLFACALTGVVGLWRIGRHKLCQ